MCGIAGFVSNDNWMKAPDLSWLDRLLAEIEPLAETSRPWEKLDGPLDILIYHFDDLMSFGLHLELVDRSAVLNRIEKLAGFLESSLRKFERFAADNGVGEAEEKVGEKIRDCLWQLRQEVLGNALRTVELMPDSVRSARPSRSSRLVAWAVEQVIENLDRLEVRGRDSAGLAVQCVIGDTGAQGNPMGDGGMGELPATPRIEDGVKIAVGSQRSVDGQTVVTFVYKVANLVGRLGDNTTALRRAIQNDDLLWRVAGITVHVNVVAHTRWASNGIISLANCHPVDGVLRGREDRDTVEDRSALFMLNGDVDNYSELMEQVVRGQGFDIDPTVTTDAKILPIGFRLGTDWTDTVEDRFAALMNRCEGSLAVVMQHPRYPRNLWLGQKGSGQSLFVGEVWDGFIVASEVYGLASRTRKSFALEGTQKGGTCLFIGRAGTGAEKMGGIYLEDGSTFAISPEPIYIHSRDIYRGSYEYFFEKEIHQAASSVRKTIKGKYRKVRGKIEFATDTQGSFAKLLGRFRDPSLRPIRRVMVIGQGTASVAAEGIAHLIDRAVRGSRIVVWSRKASEMSGFFADDSLDDMLLIAVSQSGTTTDTNRTVDVASSKGAWVHGVVNRRNSALVSKSDSCSYTSDGRDVEMAVASTKAFYSQVAAGKLIALLLASELKTMTDTEIMDEMEDLERLPADIEWVLDQCDPIRECAEVYGPSSRNWAVVGNGPNKIAAEEIRIKLSELCYKSIPCDFTEDKKHIDLSTEPLTIVVANDLPENVVQDTAKEVAIFKAHNGKPIVICARGEKRFGEYASQLIEVPAGGAGLGFVLATVAGHLWGFYAARAIDAGCEALRRVRGDVAAMLEEPQSNRLPQMVSEFQGVMDDLASGRMNAALPASTGASLAMFLWRLQVDPEGDARRRLIEQGISVLNAAVEEATRPIDSIRHQAKTVTVGISRPQEVLPLVFVKALEELSVSAAQISEQDRRQIFAVSPLIGGIEGGLHYRVVRVVEGTPVGLKGETPWIELVARMGSSVGRPSRYDSPRPSAGTKRTVLRLERAVWSTGRAGQESLLVVPLFEKEKGECHGVVLFHLDFVAHAGVQQKLAVLKVLGNRYHEVIEGLQELSRPREPEEFLESVSTRDLVLAPIDMLLSAGTR